MLCSFDTFIVLNFEFTPFCVITAYKKRTKQKQLMSAKKKIDLRNEFGKKNFRYIPFAEDANVSRNRITVKHSILVPNIIIIVHSLL